LTIAFRIFSASAYLPCFSKTTLRSFRPTNDPRIEPFETQAPISRSAVSASDSRFAKISVSILAPVLKHGILHDSRHEIWDDSYKPDYGKPNCAASKYWIVGTIEDRPEAPNKNYKTDNSGNLSQPVECCHIFRSCLLSRG
jgi:hypothetical protein